MEVGARLEREDPHTGERALVATAYMTFVAIDGNGKPQPVPALLPETPTKSGACTRPSCGASRASSSSWPRPPSTVASQGLQSAEQPDSTLSFHPLPAPTSDEVLAVLEDLICRLQPVLARSGLVDPPDADDHDDPLAKTPRCSPPSTPAPFKERPHWASAAAARPSRSEETACPKHVVARQALAPLRPARGLRSPCSRKRSQPRPRPARATAALLRSPRDQPRRLQLSKTAEYSSPSRRPALTAPHISY